MDLNSQVRQDSLLNRVKEYDLATYMFIAINLLFANDNIELFNLKQSFRELPIAVGHNDESDVKMVFFEVFSQSRIYGRFFESSINHGMRYFKLKKANIDADILISIQVVLSKYCKCILSDIAFKNPSDEVKKAIPEIQEIQHLVTPGKTELELFRFLAYLNIIYNEHFCSPTVMTCFERTRYYVTEGHIRFMRHTLSTLFANMDESRKEHFIRGKYYFYRFLEEEYRKDILPSILKGL